MESLKRRARGPVEPQLVPDDAAPQVPPDVVLAARAALPVSTPMALNSSSRLLPCNPGPSRPRTPPPWKSFPPDLTMALICTPRVGASASVPMVWTRASSTVLKSQKPPEPLSVVQAGHRNPLERGTTSRRPARTRARPSSPAAGCPRHRSSCARRAPASTGSIVPIAGRGRELEHLFRQQRAAGGRR